MNKCGVFRCGTRYFFTKVDAYGSHVSMSHSNSPGTNLVRLLCTFKTEDMLTRNLKMKENLS